MLTAYLVLCYAIMIYLTYGLYRSHAWFALLTFVLLAPITVPALYIIALATVIVDRIDG